MFKSNVGEIKLYGKLTLKADDIVKLEFRGMKRKFRVVGEDETITEDMVVSIPVNSPECYYNNTLEIAANTGLNNLNFSKNECVGDKVFGGHCHRVYLELLT